MVFTGGQGCIARAFPRMVGAKWWAVSPLCSKLFFNGGALVSHALPLCSNSFLKVGHGSPCFPFGFHFLSMVGAAAFPRFFNCFPLMGHIFPLCFNLPFDGWAWSPLAFPLELPSPPECSNAFHPASKGKLTHKGEL